MLLWLHSLFTGRTLPSIDHSNIDRSTNHHIFIVLKHYNLQNSDVLVPEVLFDTILYDLMK